MTNQQSQEPAKGAAIELRNVTKVYKTQNKGTEVHALRGVDLTVDRGEIHGIVGQSGAGKSTLIRCLTGLEEPTDGEIEVNGKSMIGQGQKDLRRSRTGIGMVFQHANLLDSRTVAANVAYPLKLAKLPKAEIKRRVEDLLETVGLSDRATSYPSELSGGQKQRVGIARALADYPPVLLCDEPTSALDGETTRQILDLLCELRSKLKVTIVIITHEMSVVREICDSVSLLDAGRIIQSGPLEQVAADVRGQLANELVPFPSLEAKDLNLERDSLLDLRFTSTPGNPTGSKVLGLASQLGGDVAAGRFETIGTTQLGRLAVTVERAKVKDAITAFEQEGIVAQEVYL
ncbi:ABC transporter [Boudabousia liubingyangii]|uniref:ABC transporter n=1 Tax=Boudabousia liubingyangii TaxID=1921764 RepID=A0A1Q5PJZ8_9ACTO|nr:ATP-binding cassette domain-containing protein [Boudabousia liubingyangii]OKL46550.1 ABC transporter [Boudabousia liubingyangii]